MPSPFIAGLPVINAHHALDLEILDCDVEDATRRDPTNCVAARAILRQHGPLAVMVYRSRVFVQWQNSHWERYRTPAALRDEEIAFDRGGKAFQGAARRITLMPLAQSNRATGTRQGGPDKPRTGRMRRPRRVLTNVRPHA